MNEVEEIKEKIDIVEFIRGYLELRKAGINYKGSCPFHQEKTPSFMVNPERRIFKCFGCGEGGDVFEFIMKMEGLNFPEALEMLAGRAGVILPKQRRSPKEYQEEKDTKTKLFEINNWSARVLHEILVNHKIAAEARDYLSGRKITNKTVIRWQIGFAPQKSILEAYLTKKGYNIFDIRKAGSPDKFRNRIIFPIWDLMDNIVGFTGRALEKGQEPKYYNTPESPIFHKGKVLYGLNFAKSAIRQEKQVILVEGQTDVILSHQSGITNVVASSGTALTTDHIKILSRYTSNIVFCFDNDEAGFTASRKAIIMAYDLELNPQIIEVPDQYKDVGEVIENDPKLWIKTSKIFIPAFEWVIKKTFKKYSEILNASQRRLIARELIPFLVHIVDPVENRHYKKILAQKLSVGERIIEETVERFLDKDKNSKKIKQEDTNKTPKKLSVEENLIGLLFSYSENIKEIVAKLDYQEFSDNNMAAIYKKVQSCYTTNSCSQSEKKCDNKSNITTCLVKKLPDELKKRVNFLVIEISDKTKNYSQEEISEAVLEQAMRIKGRKKEATKSQYALAIAEAENSGNRNKLKELIEKFQKEISRK